MRFCLKILTVRSTLRSFLKKKIRQQIINENLNCSHRFLEKKIRHGRIIKKQTNWEKNFHKGILPSFGKKIKITLLSCGGRGHLRKNVGGGGGHFRKYDIPKNCWQFSVKCNISDIIVKNPAIIYYYYVLLILDHLLFNW